MPTNVYVYALNTRVIQLLGIVIRVNNASAGDFIEQYSCKSKELLKFGSKFSSLLLFLELNEKHSFCWLLLIVMLILSTSLEIFTTLSFDA